MNIFLQHVGSPGNKDLGFTVTKGREIAEIVNALTPDCQEAEWMRSDVLRSAFPSGTLNCWGVPPGAKPRFQDTRVGDLILFFPQVGANGALEQIGIVRAICPVEAWDASRVLWPETPGDRLFPHLFFFDTEVGFRYWPQFLEDMDYHPDWDPRGFYRRIAPARLSRFGGATGYLSFLRDQCGFKPLRTGP